MTAPDQLRQLVERFTAHRAAYTSGHYKETQVRRDFIDPLFKLIGWDIDNAKGAAEQYREVIHEDAIKIAGATKAPDYAFRIGGVPKFYVEAKKPSVNLQDDMAASFQLRRYAWTAHLPLSILTDFEEFAVYDCRVKPVKTDKATTARVQYFGFEKYEEKWDDIMGLFSPAAILRGSFDAYADSAKKKRGTAEVDDEFLKDIEEWRKLLAQNIALRNKKLKPRELNFVVQRTIDRIVFLRICEDRGIEDYGRLAGLREGAEVYPRLCSLFREADDRYNSGLFHFKPEKGREIPDELSLKVTVDDKPLKEILKRLYYPDSPYEFAVLPAEILGQVYEQFLGSVIHLTAGHHARIEQKPEVRKAGGVYYTPAYIVRYIVENTVGKLLEGKKPGPRSSVNDLRILDPACGSGSFLIAAYQYLVDWHRDRYVEDGPEKHTKELYKGPGGEWRLSTDEKKRILLNNIYGVDIDPQAVEVTKLSLLLKVLEGETQESIRKQLQLFKERALPDLGDNIKCGNSLVGSDFALEGNLDFVDEDERLKVNPFDWETEYPSSASAGGFDAVIGNPPWGQKAIGDDEQVKTYIRSRYSSVEGIYDLFRPFAERGIELTRKRGAFGMVLPDIVLLKDYIGTRRLMLEQLTLTAIDWWGMAFEAAVIDAATIIGRKEKPARENVVLAVVHDPTAPLSHGIPQVDFWKNPRLTFNLFLTPETQKLLDALGGLPKLGDYFEIHEGVHSGNIRKELFVQKRLDKTCRPLLFGRSEITPYALKWEGQYIRLSAVPKRRTAARYANVGQAVWHESPKLLVRRTGDFVLAAVDQQGLYASNNFFLVVPKRECGLSLDGVCALLNSRFMTWFFQTIEPRRGRVFAELKIKHLSTFPLPQESTNSKQYELINRLGAQRRELATQEQPSTPEARKSAERAARQLDERIQAAVLSLLELGSDPSLEQNEKEVTNGDG